MQNRQNYRIRRSAAALAAAVAAVGLATSARAQTFITSSTSSDSQCEPSGTAGTSELYLGSYFAIDGAAYKYADWGILQFAAPTLSPGTTVSSVNSDVTLTMYNYADTYNSTNNVTLSFYLTTDTSTPTAGSGSPTPESTLLYNTGKDSGGNQIVGGFDTIAGDPGTFGQTGIGTPGSQIIPIGTATYNATGLTANQALTYNLTLNAAAEQFIQKQTNTASPVTLVVASNEADSNQVSFDGPTSAYAPQVTYDVTTTTATSDTSKLYYGAYSPSNTTKTVNLPIGKLVTINGTPTYCVLAGATTTAQVSLSNGSTVSGDNLTYSVSGSNASASVTSPGPEPIAPGGTSYATVGFSGSDTTITTGGTPATGTVTIANNSNFATDTTPVTINLNGGSINSLALDERFVNTTSGTSTPNFNKVLVGTNKTSSVALGTTNPVAGDYGNDALTTLTLLNNSTTTAYGIYDPYTGNTVGTISANTNGLGDQLFANNNTGTANASVAATISGVFGSDVAGATEGTITPTNAPNYTSFVQSSITGMGLTGENDSMRVYLQWQGYQPASVSSPLVTVTPNSTAIATLTNAATNDNVYTTGGVMYNNGLRAGAVITGTGPFNQTWSSGGWNFQSGFTTGTQISGNQGTQLAGGGTTALGTTAGTIGFTTNAQMINGTYGATMTVGLENEQDIAGATLNDLGNITIQVQSTVTSNPSTQSGSYVLNGGTLSAPATTLTGSFTQNGGTATFAKITGSGSLSGSLVLNGGTTTLATGGGGSTVGSLTVSPNAVLDLSNNHLYIDYGSGSDPITTIASYIKSGYHNGGWNGPGIIASAAQTPTNGLLYGVGYADSKDNVVAGLTSGQIEVMYTLLGDANLDHLVNTSDFNIVAANFNQSITGWDQGDFNYDGLVNTADFNELAANFNQGDSGTASAGDMAALDAFAAANGISLPTSSVPEPASGVMALFGVGILARRARRRDNR